jgi:hypothetical protein
MSLHSQNGNCGGVLLPPISKTTSRASSAPSRVDQGITDAAVDELIRIIGVKRLLAAIERTAPIATQVPFSRLWLQGLSASDPLRAAWAQRLRDMKDSASRT